MTSLQRAWRGGKNDWRLHLLSIFSVAVAFVTLASALLVVVNVDGLRDRWARAGRASVYFRVETTPAQVRAIEDAVRAAPGVTDVRYVSSDEARREVIGRGDKVLSDLPSAAFPASLEVMVDEGTEGGKLDSLASRAGPTSSRECGDVPRLDPSPGFGAEWRCHRKSGLGLRGAGCRR